jgi:PhnB protein
MPRQNRIEELDRAITALLAGRAGKPPARAWRASAALAPLVRLAGELRQLPREEFRSRLKADLERSATMTAATPASAPAVDQPAPRTVATPALSFVNAALAIEFYKRAFGATEDFRLTEPSGKLGHAEIRIGEAAIFLADEYPDYGRRSAQTIGASPISIELLVPDVDAFVRKAVAEGATLVRPPKDEFYGHRSAQIDDPFGYSWHVSTRKEEVPLAEVHRRFAEFFQPAGQAAEQAPAAPRVKFIREGFRTVTPYLVAREAEKLFEFVQKAFDAEGFVAGIGSQGGFHAEYRIGDSMLMIGGGHNYQGEQKLHGLHLYVPDVDAMYQRALAAGAASVYAPADQPYGDREAGVRDVAGNLWYIATHKGESYKPAGMASVQPFLHPLRGEPLVRFLSSAFGARELHRYATPDGVIHHATVRIGDATLELGEAHGEYQPLPSMFYLYVPDADALYERALLAGAKSLHQPADQPYGDRAAAVTDTFGNTWYVATHIRDLA